MNWRRLMGFPQRPRRTPYHIVEKAVLCITAILAARLPQWVKMRKSHSEHFSTAVPQKADVVLNAANGSFVPILLQKSFCTGDQKFSGL
jgi:hypothetical protein